MIRRGAVDGAGIVVAGLRKGVGSPCCWHESKATHTDNDQGYCDKPGEPSAIHEP